MSNVRKELGSMEQELLAISALDTRIDAPQVSQYSKQNLDDQKYSRGQVVRTGAKVLTALGGLYLIKTLFPRVYAQSSRPTFIAGSGSAASIDGACSTGEWDDANEYPASHYDTKINDKGEAYFRVKHDSSKVYMLFDVPSDTRPTGATGKGSGGINLFLDRKNDEGFMELDDNVLLAGITEENGAFTGAGNIAMTYSQKLGPSPHSSTPHRIWEFEDDLDLFTKNAPKGQDGSPTVGFWFSLFDSYGNEMAPCPITSFPQINFAPYPVSEGIELLLPVTLAALFAVYSKRRNNLQRLKTQEANKKQ